MWVRVRVGAWEEGAYASSHIRAPAGEAPSALAGGRLGGGGAARAARFARLGEPAEAKAAGGGEGGGG